MIVPHNELAALCAAIYNPASAWDHWSTAGGVVVGHRRFNGIDVLAYRGSDMPGDWMRDLNELPVDHPALGHVHRGFLDGMDESYDAVAPWLDQRVVITGHSLGGAHALIEGALLYVRKKWVQQITVLGCPRPGFLSLSQILRASGADITMYRNRNDPVTEVPYLLGLYQRPVELTPCDGQAGQAESLIECPEDHYIAHYCAALPLQMISAA